MKAFYKTKAGQIIKVFDKGDDWQLLDGKVEVWYSQWTIDRKGSLASAVNRFLKLQYSEDFHPGNLVIC